MTEAEILVLYRGVTDRCHQCDGWGVVSYGSDATWRGGIGGQAITIDVCDACWGSGDAHRHGADLRALTAERAQWEREQALAWLARGLGVQFNDLQQRLLDAAELCDQQSRRRKVPETGQEPFFWRRSWERLGDALRMIARGDR